MGFWEAILLAIIEGLTEFLPVSSTGHMILVSSVLGIAEDPFTKFFEVAIQLGAILSVVVLYYRKFFRRDALFFYFKLAIGVIPALVLGVFFSDRIDELLESSFTVAVMLLIGGLIFLFIDKIFYKKARRPSNSEPNLTQSLIIGLWQCLALVPGVSRSAASIIGGLQQGLNRKNAAEFSFFLAVPTMAAATIYKFYELWKTEPQVITDTENIWLFVLGNIVAFIVAAVAIRFFVGFLQHRGFTLFGWYRIIVGSVILLLHFTGIVILS